MFLLVIFCQYILAFLCLIVNDKVSMIITSWSSMIALERCSYHITACNAPKYWHIFQWRYYPIICRALFSFSVRIWQADVWSLVRYWDSKINFSVSNWRYASISRYSTGNGFRPCYYFSSTWSSVLFKPLMFTNCLNFLISVLVFRFLFHQNHLVADFLCVKYPDSCGPTKYWTHNHEG